MNPDPALLDYTARQVAAGGAAVGGIAGLFGTFAVLRRQSMLGDAISHAALPGIVLAWLVTGLHEVQILAVGAAITGLLGALAVLWIRWRSPIPEDGALGIVLSVFFGFGILLLTQAQRRPDLAQAGLERFLFGEAATLTSGDVRFLAGMGVLGVTLLLAFWKEAQITTFDPDFAGTLGIPRRFVEVLLTVLLVLAIVTGLQAVGVVLMSAFVAAPAIAARQWTDRLWATALVASGIGSASGLVGALASARLNWLPAGPSMVVVVSLVALGSVLLAPDRGLVWQWRRRRGRGGSLDVLGPGGAGSPGAGP